MIRRMVTRSLDAQNAWSDPLGAWIQQNVLLPAFKGSRSLKDLLNGTWLGHSVHAAITDVPVGAFTTAIVLDAVDSRRGADVATGVGVASMLGSALAGWADYTDTDVPPQRGYATVHQLLMLGALALYGASLWSRVSSGRQRGSRPIQLSLAGYALMAISAYIGGEIVYGLGNMVDRHAFSTFGTEWRPLDVPEVGDDAPTKVESPDGPLVVVRCRGRVFALHDTCAHAGCSLSDGRVVGDTIECACHGSRFRLSDGCVVRGPSTFDQPAYEVRIAKAGAFEARHRPATAGATESGERVESGVVGTA